MHLRTFTANDMPTAMQMVREELGDEAIILSSKMDKGTRSIIVTAAIDEDMLEPPRPAPNKRSPAVLAEQIQDLRHEIQQVLRFHNVPDVYLHKMVRLASDAMLESLIALEHASARSRSNTLLRKALAKVLAEYFRFEPLNADAFPRGVMLVGTPGIGKTLTIAKLAAELTLSKGNARTHPLTVITTDNKRAGGVEQLQAFTDILNIPLHIAEHSKDIESHLASLPKGSHVLVDTAGCNPYDAADFREIANYGKIKGMEPVLVLPAGGDSLEAVDMVECFSTMPIRRLIITRADSARRFGGVLAAAAALGLRFSGISGSASITQTLEPASPDVLAQYLLRYQSNELTR